MSGVGEDYDSQFWGLSESPGSAGHSDGGGGLGIHINLTVL